MAMVMVKMVTYEVRMKRWPLEHITKIYYMDFVCLHPLNKNMGLSVEFINSCHILGTQQVFVELTNEWMQE